MLPAFGQCRRGTQLEDIPDVLFGLAGFLWTSSGNSSPLTERANEADVGYPGFLRELPKNGSLGCLAGFDSPLRKLRPGYGVVEHKHIRSVCTRPYDTGTRLPDDPHTRSIAPMTRMASRQLRLHRTEHPTEADRSQRLAALTFLRDA
ncbi:MAG: hypothetical protein QOJ92_1227 [Frankiales bacterium]|nr:hypothetical protein [Frankiales bacterium]